MSENVSQATYQDTLQDISKATSQTTSKVKSRIMTQVQWRQDPRLKSLDGSHVTTQHTSRVTTGKQTSEAYGVGYPREQKTAAGRTFSGWPSLKRGGRPHGVIRKVGHGGS
jgi:hypothetical protein